MWKSLLTVYRSLSSPQSPRVRCVVILLLLLLLRGDTSLTCTYGTRAAGGPEMALEWPASKIPGVAPASRHISPRRQGQRRRAGTGQPAERNSRRVTRTHWKTRGLLGVLTMPSVRNCHHIHSHIHSSLWMRPHSSLILLHGRTYSSPASSPLWPNDGCSPTLYTVHNWSMPCSVQSLRQNRPALQGRSVHERSGTLSVDEPVKSAKSSVTCSAPSNLSVGSDQIPTKIAKRVGRFPNSEAAGMVVVWNTST